MSILGMLVDKHTVKRGISVQLSICSRTEENNGKLESIWSVRILPGEKKITSGHQ